MGDSRDFKADGTQGFYADHQAEAVLAGLGHSLLFYKHGYNTCWHCGLGAKLEFSNPAESVWTLSGPALDERCGWVGVEYRNVLEEDYAILHSVNGATYGPPMKILRLTKRQITTEGKNRYMRWNGRGIGQTAQYVSIVRKQEMEVPRIFVGGGRDEHGEAIPVYCADCIPAGLDLGSDRVELWEEDSNGWVSVPICSVCKSSIPVIVDGEEASHASEAQGPHGAGHSEEGPAGQSGVSGSVRKDEAQPPSAGEGDVHR